jgi:hypothetical protein
VHASPCLLCLSGHARWRGWSAGGVGCSAGQRLHLRPRHQRQRATLTAQHGLHVRCFRYICMSLFVTACNILPRSQNRLNLTCVGIQQTAACLHTLLSAAPGINQSFGVANLCIWLCTNSSKPACPCPCCAVLCCPAGCLHT